MQILSNLGDLSNKIFIDSEFIDDGRTIDLISIASVSRNSTVYSQNVECDFKKANPWVKEHVFPSLVAFNMEKCMPDLKHHRALEVWFDCAGIADRIRKQADEVCEEAEVKRPEFWGYYCDYDWVALSQLFGTMMELPKNFPMHCMDLKMLADLLGGEKLPPIPPTLILGQIPEHNALRDALEIQFRFDYLVAKSAKV